MDLETSFRTLFSFCQKYLVEIHQKSICKLLQGLKRPMLTQVGFCLLGFNTDMKKYVLRVPLHVLFQRCRRMRRDVATLAFLFKAQADLPPAEAGKLSCKDLLKEKSVMVSLVQLSFDTYQSCNKDGNKYQQGFSLRIFQRFFFFEVSSSVWDTFCLGKHQLQPLVHNQKLAYGTKTQNTCTGNPLGMGGVWLPGPAGQLHSCSGFLWLSYYFSYLATMS